MTDTKIEVRLHELILDDPTAAPDDQAASMDSRVELRLTTTAGELFTIADALADSANATERALRRQGDIPEHEQAVLAHTRDLSDRLEQATNDALNASPEHT